MRTSMQLPFHNCLQPQSPTAPDSGALFLSVPSQPTLSDCHPERSEGSHKGSRITLRKLSDTSSISEVPLRLRRIGMTDETNRGYIATRVLTYETFCGGI